MKKSRFTEAQVVGILKEADAGTSVAELARKHGVHGNTIRLWRDKYVETSDLVRLKQLEAEIGQMQRIIARQTLEIDAMKETWSQKTAGALAAKGSGEGLASRRNDAAASLPVRWLHEKHGALSPETPLRRADRGTRARTGRRTTALGMATVEDSL